MSKNVTMAKKEAEGEKLRQSRHVYISCRPSAGIPQGQGPPRNIRPYQKSNLKMTKWKRDDLVGSISNKTLRDIIDLETTEKNHKQLQTKGNRGADWDNIII